MMTIREATPADLPQLLTGAKGGKQGQRGAEGGTSAALRIRDLAIGDVNAVVEMGRMEWPNVFPGEYFDAEHMRAILACHFNRECFGAWVVANTDESIFGFLGLCLSPVLMTKKLVADDTWWYVDPRVRGRLGLQLVRVGEAWAKSKGARAIHLGIHHEKYRPILERMRYRVATLTFEKDL